MRTKTLLLTAALSAAGLATSMAQVYSVNAVGYIKLTLPAGFTMVANQLNNADNKLNTLFPGAGFGDTVFKFNPASGFESSVFFGEWSPNLTLNPGEGAFYQAGAASEAVLVGEVPQGNGLKVSLVSGFQIISSIVPQSAKLEDLGMPADFGDTVFFFRNGAYESSVFFGAWSPDAVPKVGEAFWLQRGGGAADWTRNFSVNP
ncbi:MAG: hypothetical protein AB1813_23390 [Verrucomicrobiota bacterium]|jgi:hypothetical protein